MARVIRMGSKMWISVECAKSASGFLRCSCMSTGANLLHTPVRIRMHVHYTLSVRRALKDKNATDEI